MTLGHHSSNSLENILISDKWSSNFSSKASAMSLLFKHIKPSLHSHLTYFRKCVVERRAKTVDGLLMRARTLPRNLIVSYETKGISWEWDPEMLKELNFCAPGFQQIPIPVLQNQCVGNSYPPCCRSEGQGQSLGSKWVISPEGQTSSKEGIAFLGDRPYNNFRVSFMVFMGGALETKSRAKYWAIFPAFYFKKVSC